MKQIVLLLIAFLFINKTFSQNLDWVFKPQERVSYDYLADMDLIWKYNPSRGRKGHYATFFERNGKQRKFGNFSQTQSLPSDYFTDLLLVSKNGKFGFINKEGKLIIDAKYRSFTDVRSNYDYREFVPVSVDGKNFGVIDKQGTVVISFKFQAVWTYNFTSMGGYQAVYNKRVGLAIVHNHDGRYSIVNSTGTPVTPLLSNPPIIMSVRNNYTAINFNITSTPQGYKYNHSTKNLEKLPESVTEMNGLMFYGNYTPKYNKVYALLDDTFEPSNKIILDSTSGLASVKTSNGWQMIDRNSKPLTNDAYTFIFPMDKNGLAFYRKRNLQYSSGFMDKTGKEIAPDSLCEFFPNEKFINDLIVFGKNSLFGVMDIKGNTVIPPIYQKIEILDCECNFIKIEKDKKEGLVDISGKEILAPIYDRVIPVNDSLIIVKYLQKSGILNIRGEEFLPIIYDSIISFRKSQNNKDFRISFIKDNNISGVIDSQGKILLSMKNAKMKLLTYDLVEISEYKVGKGEVIKIASTVIGEEVFAHSVGVAKLPDTPKK